MPRLTLYDDGPLLDANGDPVSGGSLWTYENGTSTPVPLYSDSALSVGHTWPVVADSAGVFPQMYGTVGVLKVVAKDSSGVTLHTIDDVVLEVKTGETNSLETTGYDVFPSGLIMQWGGGHTYSGVGAVTFPLTFPTGIYRINVCLTEGTGPGILIDAHTPTLTGMTVRAEEADGSIASVQFDYQVWGK